MKAEQINHEKIWIDYGKMIMKIAHNMNEKYNKPFDELLSEGVLGVLTKLPKFDPDRGASMCTYIYRCAYFKMLDYCIKPQREIPTEVYTSDEDKNPFIQKETKPNWLQSFLSELTEEAQHLIKIVFESPEELYHAIKPTRPIRSKNALRDYMIDVHDWKSNDVDQVFKEVAQCL